MENNIKKEEFYTKLFSKEGKIAARVKGYVFNYRGYEFGCYKGDDRVWHVIDLNTGFCMIGGANTKKGAIEKLYGEENWERYERIVKTDEYKRLSKGFQKLISKAKKEVL